MSNSSILTILTIVIGILLGIDILGKLCIATLPKYNNYKVFNSFLSETEINDIEKCIDDLKIDKNCMEAKQFSYITNKLEKITNASYMSISHARYSDNSNYDAQTHHRDVKTYGVSKYPNCFTFIIYLDNASLMMGNETIHAKKGDAVLFNSFNLHKGVYSAYDSKRRRIFQFFHVFFDKDEQADFYKNHSYEKHINISNSIIKHTNNLVDTRSLFEFTNTFLLINGVPNKCKYITFKDPSKYFQTIDNIDYYLNF